MNSSRRIALTLLMVATLSACGFQLRGSRADSRMPFNSVYLVVAARTPLERDLRSTILAQEGVIITADAKSADVTIRVISATEEKKILTLNAQGQVREYSLIYRLNFDVKDKAGKIMLAPTELALQTFMSFSESQALAKETEEKMVFNDLRGDAVSQIVRRLARLKPEDAEK